MSSNNNDNNSNPYEFNPFDDVEPGEYDPPESELEQDEYEEEDIEGEETELIADIPDNDENDEISEDDELDASSSTDKNRKKKRKDDKNKNILTDLGLEDPDDNEPPKEELTVSAKSNKIEAFLREFKHPKTREYKYYDMICAMAYNSDPVLIIDYNDMLVYPGGDSIVPLFYEDIDSALLSAREATESIIYDTNSDYKSEKNNLVVRISNFDIKRSFREIDADLIDKMVTIDAIVNRSTKKKPWLLASVYKCTKCGGSNYAQHNKMVKKCTGCESNKLVFDKKGSKYVDYKQIYVQELPENLPPGQLPEKLLVSLYGNDLANKCRPGDRIKMTCIVRLEYDSNTLRDLENHDPLGIKGKNFGTTFEMVLDANNIEKLEGFNSLSKNTTVTDSDIAKIEGLRGNRDLPNKLVNSFAPHIYGHEIHKESILLMMVGSISTTTEEGDKKRGDSNLLFVGDAGLAKSEMLKFAMKVAPRGLYTSGRGSSAAGLTAAVVKDKSGAMMLEAGAVVMADQGLCCIDEFDKMKPEDRSALHEAMEQQTCSVAKGGIIATLNARTAILAAANPIDSVYDPNQTIVTNTGLPPTLISRFDLIYVLKDIINMEDDSAVVDYILGIPSADNRQQLAMKQYGVFDSEFLAKYIMYAKHYQKELPELTLEAKLDIKEYYNMLRQRADKDSNNATQTMTVTARIVKALERIAVSRARLLLKAKVTTEDTGRAKFLMNQMFKSFGIDIETGNTNLGIMFGKPVSSMSKHRVITQILDGISSGGRDEVSHDNLVTEMLDSRKWMNLMDADSTIAELKSKGALLMTGKSRIYQFNRDAVT